MASDLLPYALFGENVPEIVVGSKATKGDDKYESSNIWKVDQDHDVYSSKQEAAYFSGDWIVNSNNDLWSTGHAEVLERDWVVNDKMFMSLDPQDKWKDGENPKGDNLDVPGLGERGFSRESRVREMDLKATFASVTEWFEDLALDSEESEASTRIEIQNRQVDTKFWLAELWEIGHSNLENLCASGGKPGNTVRENNVLFAEWGTSNSSRQRSKDYVENQKISECKDHGPNSNAIVLKNTASQENQKFLSPSWDHAVDIMLGFHVPENYNGHFKEHGEGFESNLGSSLNIMSRRFGNLAGEVVSMENGIFPLGEEENDIISKCDGQQLEHIVDMGTVFEGRNIAPIFINPYTGVLHLVKENSLAQVHQTCKKVHIADLQCSTGLASTDCKENDQVHKDMQFGALTNYTGQEVPRGSPHEALFFTLSYLSLQDLLSVERVCKSLRAAVKNDVLLWRHLHVEHPLSKKLTNDALLQLSTRAKGHLQCLSLVECLRITDDGLKLVLDSNSNLTKLCLPGCTRVSAEGIVQMVKGHTEQNRNGKPGLKHLRIRGLYGLTKEHLDNLKSTLDCGLQQPSESAKPQFYHNGHYSFSYDDDRLIDVEVCPKCENARLVYDCTRERCQQRKDHKLQQCRGCILCIARCEECGRCIDDNEYEETFCLDLLCSSCWLQLPKCLECNRPGCGRHADHFMRKPDTTFVCGDCRGVSAGSLGPDFHGFA